MANASPLTYVDQIMAMQSMMAIQKVFEKGDFRLKNVLLMMIMLCFDGIRKYFVKALEQLDIITWVNTKCQTLRAYKRRKLLTDHETQPIEWIPNITLNFEPSLTFWQSVFESEKTNPSTHSQATITYNSTSDKAFQQTNMFEYTLNETYTNVAIIGSDFEAYFQDSLNVSSSHVNGHTTIKSITPAGAEGNTSAFRDHADVKSFSDMLPFPVFAKEFNKMVQDVQIDHIEISDILARNYMQNHRKNYEDNREQSIITFLKQASMSFKIDNNTACKLMYSPEYNIRNSSPVFDIYIEMLPTLLSKYKQWNLILGFYQLFYMLAFIDKHLFTIRKTNIGGYIFAAKGKHIFGCDLSKAFSKFVEKGVNQFVWCEMTCLKQLSKLPDYEKVSIYLHKLFFQNYEHPNMKTASATSSASSNTVILYGNLKSWIAYVQDLSTNSRIAASPANTTESQVYILKVADETITEEVPNPAYAEWETYMEKLQKMSQSGNAPAPPLPPNKTITNTKIVKKVVTEHINAIYKDMSNLYLRREDKRKLLSCLTQYHQNKSLLKDLGIPNKLGIMLFGEPGTGKSSTISAIASFLKKNIYYVQMNDVKSNAELMMLFTHVTKNCANAGIIVMEDIDAMTKVVHKRTTAPSTEAQDNKEAQLTLEFFLNILQGSLTADDTIFITTTNHIECLDPAFYRDGRFDVKIEMRAADHYQIDCIFERFFKRTIDPQILAKIPEFKHTPATFIARFREFLLESHTDDKDILSIFMDP